MTRWVLLLFFFTVWIIHTWWSYTLMVICLNSLVWIIWRCARLGIILNLVIDLLSLRKVFIGSIVIIKIALSFLMLTSIGIIIIIIGHSIINYKMRIRITFIWHICHRLKRRLPLPLKTCLIWLILKLRRSAIIFDLKRIRWLRLIRRGRNSILILATKDWP